MKARLADDLSGGAVRVIFFLCPLFGSVLPRRRAYWLNKWIHETDAEQIIMIAGRVWLTSAEQEAA